MVCEKCGKEFFEDWRTEDTKRDKRQSKEPRFCSKICSQSRVFSEETKAKISKALLKEEKRACKICGKKLRNRTKNDLCGSCSSDSFRLFFVNLTKGEIFSRAKNWQSARSDIRKHAYKVYFIDNKKEYKCEKCGYSKHVEVCHIKAVSEFDDLAKIEEINSIDNLTGLCPNCHWEFDNL